MMKKICFLFVALLVFAYSKSQSVNPNEFEKAITIGKDSVSVLDVRTPKEFETGHLENALHADWLNKAEFERRVSFVNKDKPVYIYCLSGGRSAAAANYLRTKGYKNVKELAGGITAWNANKKKITPNSTTTKEMELDAYNKAILSKVVLVDVGASWCPPCVQMKPIIDKLVKKYATSFKILHVDGGVDKKVNAFLKVEKLPVFIVYKNGIQIWRKDGVATEMELKKALGLK